MNKDMIEGNWEAFKGKAKQFWADLGDTDYKLLFEGKRQEFIGKEQARSGKSQDEIEARVKEFEKSCGCSFSEKPNKAA